MRDGQTTNDVQVRIELLSQWMLEAEFRNTFLNNIFIANMHSHFFIGISLHLYLIY